MVTKATAINTVQDYIKECMDNGVRLTSAWMFGSYSKGNQRDISDIDVALVSEGFSLNFLENNHKTALINYNYPDIETHHFNSDIFNKDDPFINEIKRTGIRIYPVE